MTLYNLVTLQTVSGGGHEPPDLSSHQCEADAVTALHAAFVDSMIRNEHLPKGSTPASIGLSPGCTYEHSLVQDGLDCDCYVNDKLATVEWRGGADRFWIVKNELEESVEDEPKGPEYTLVVGEVGEPFVYCKECRTPLRWPAPKMTPVYCQSKEYVGSDICLSCMRKGKLYIHYLDEAGEEHIEEHPSMCFTEAFRELVHRMCLVNSAGEETEFETIPDHIAAWLNEIGYNNYGLFPNLVKYWSVGYSNVQYAFVLNYEIPHAESDNQTNTSVKIGYMEQLQALAIAARDVAEHLPDAAVRMTERAAFSNQHNLEIAFMYPCDPSTIEDAAEKLESEFSHIWHIGSEVQEKET